MKFSLTLLTFSAHASANINGVAPNRLSFYISRLSPPNVPAPEDDSHSASFRCFDDSDLYAQLNDDYCDCQDGSDEPGTSACAGIAALTRQRDYYEEDVFEVENFHMIFKDGSNNVPIEFTKDLIKSATPGFYCPTEQRYIPAWKVNDNICDCCDGADESPSSACRGLHDCKEALERRREEKEKRRAEMEAVTVKRRERIERGSELLSEWLSAVEAIPREVLELEREIESLKVARSAEASSEGGEEEGAGEGGGEAAGLAGKVKGPLSEYAKWMDSGEEREEKAVDEEEAADEEEESVGEVSREYVTEFLRQVFSRARALWDKVWKSSSTTDQNGSAVPSPPPEDPIQILESTIHIKNDRLTKSQAALSRKYIFDIYPEVAEWEGQTLHKKFAEVHLELAFFGKATTREGFHGVRNSWGEFTEVIRSRGAIVPVPNMYRDLVGPVAFRYVKGDAHSCPNEREREFVVFFVCRLGGDELLAMEEPYPCLGTAVVSSEMFCGLTEFKVVPPSERNSLKRDEL